jgi:ligand-binding sensor domain-containing protein
MIKCYCCLFFLFFPLCLFAQEYSYTHYDIGEGLAGSTVYCITQDLDGFIWAGTETGVSRFDGTHFKNFTTADGLPDIEILRIFGDSKGRVWMAPFRKSVCYYFKGRIYNQDNDSLLRRIRLKANIENFAEDSQGNILILEKTAVHLVTAGGGLKEYDSIGNQPIRECVGASPDASGHFWLQVEDKLYSCSDKGFSYRYPIFLPNYNSNYIAISPRWATWREDTNRTAIRSLVTGQVFYRPFAIPSYKHVSFSLLDDSLIYYNEIDGVTEYNIRTRHTKRFLPGKSVSGVFRDQSRDLWFTTLGQGIFRLNSDEFRTIQLSMGGDGPTSVFGIKRIGSELWAGNDHNSVFKISLPDHTIRSGTSFIKPGKNRALFIDTLENNHVLLGSDMWILNINSSDMASRNYNQSGIKSAFRESRDRLLLSTSSGALVFDPYRNLIVDTLWRERTTALISHHDSIYVGTLNGLYRIAPDKSTVFLGSKIPFLRKRISSFAFSSDKILWIASYDDAGVIGVRNDSVVATITKKQGLTSDICRTLLFYNNILWVGTDKGLNRVELDKPGFPITRYTANDGLGSDIINTIYADGSTIYIGSPAGLSFFDEGRIRPVEGCRLHLLAVLNAGKDRIADTAGLRLSYKESGIRLEFAGISYRSVGNIMYRYRLIGLDSTWKTTKDTYLEYPTLPSGKYEFQLQAVNKFDIPSRQVSLRFVVDTPFWHTIWFYGLALVVFFSLIWLFVSHRIRGIRRRQEEKEELRQRMTELEHKALQSQMNPHFIFNCLNSIQQYIFDQDILAANKYISGFAKLIRATLYNSTQAFISLADEIDFLSGYLSLEKLRFKEKMDYFLEVDPDIERDSFLIPPMLIQPYVENSMRHGLRHKMDGRGTIRVKMQCSGDRLVVTIEDNGIGREKAGQFKTREHIEYQSRGMSLTADRIRIMNMDHGHSIKVDVTDRMHENGQPAGTRVVLYFPLFHKTVQNENL